MIPNVFNVLGFGWCPSIRASPCAQGGSRRCGGGGLSRGTGSCSEAVGGVGIQMVPCFWGAMKEQLGSSGSACWGP